MSEDILDTEDICANCKYYCQHFLLHHEFRNPYWVNCGHCIFPRSKHRKPTCKACNHFEVRT